MTQLKLERPEPPEQDPAWAFYGCADAGVLRNPRLAARLVQNLKDAGFEVFGSASHKFGGEGGVTATAIIGASCADVHTWPEFGSAILRCFYCQDHAKYGVGHAEHSNDQKAKRFLELMIEELLPTYVFYIPERTIPVIMPRGIPATWRPVKVPALSAAILR